MKLLLSILCTMVSFSAICQQTEVSKTLSLPDSVLQKFADMHCSCMTQGKIEAATIEEGKQALQGCFKSVMDLYSLSDEAAALVGIMKDAEKKSVFIDALFQKLNKECTSFSTYYKTVEAGAALPEPLATVKEDYFLDSKKMTARKLKVKKNDAQMRTWNGYDQKNPRIQMVFDIRYVFKTEEEAKVYYAGKLSFLNEGAPETTNTLKNLDVSASNVYGQDDTLVGAFGDLDLKQINYVFRIKNVVAKVFISGSKKMTDAETLQIAKEAIARIKAAK
jgi:hypothetical protein